VQSTRYANALPVPGINFSRNLLKGVGGSVSKMLLDDLDA